MRNIEETRNYFIKETNQSELLSKKHKKICTTLNCLEHFLILACAVTRYVSIFAFASSVDIPVGIARSNRVRNLCSNCGNLKVQVNN